MSRFETRSGPEQAALPAIVAEANLDGLRLSAANDFAVTPPPGEKYFGAERFRIHLVGSVDPDGATHLTLRTIEVLVCNWCETDVCGNRIKKTNRVARMRKRLAPTGARPPPVERMLFSVEFRFVGISLRFSLGYRPRPRSPTSGSRRLSAPVSPAIPNRSTRTFACARLCRGGAISPMPRRGDFAEYL